MKNRGTIIWFIIAALLILAGLIIFASVMTFHGWDFNKLSTGKYEYNSYLISEDFDSIAVKTDTAEIIFKLSDDGKCKVECYEEEKSKHHVTVKENTLDISFTESLLEDSENAITNWLKFVYKVVTKNLKKLQFVTF